MSEKAKALGISEGDLTKAMILVRNLRIQALMANLDPRAIRIALIFANHVDRYFASRKITPETLIKLEEIGLELFQQTRSSRKW